jgi:hypothetical protein
MARFKYLGEPAKFNSFLAEPAALKGIVLNQKDGTKRTLTPIPPAESFPVGEDLGYDITDERSVYQLRADSRYEEIV